MHTFLQRRRRRLMEVETPLQRRRRIITYALVSLVFIGCWASMFIVWDSTAPSPGALYDQDSRTPRDFLNYFLKRHFFIEGVQEAVTKIKNNKPVRVTCFGMPQRINDPDCAPVITDYGIEVESLGCCVDALEDFRSQGRDAALRWYAARGIYAVNSSKYQKAKSPKLSRALN